MTTIGLIGSGNIGSTVAHLAVDAGYDVVLSNSRGPETLADLVGELGDRATAGTATEAAQRGDLVVVTIPLHAIDQLPADALAGKTVIDTCNYYPERDGHIASLDDESTTTSELVAAQAPEAHVVKGFNNIYFKHLRTLARPAGAEDRTALAIAGDDDTAKQEVVNFLDAIGYDTHDAGALAEGWRFQRDTAAYATLYSAEDDFETPVQRTAAEVADRLAQSKRYRDMD